MASNPWTSQHRLGRLLVACVVRASSDREIVRGLDGLREGDALELVRLSRAHGVAPLAHQRMSAVTHPLARRLVGALEVDRAVAQARHQLTLRAVAEVGSALAHPFLVLKGPALSLGWYDDPAVRVYHDLDLLVQPRDFSASLDALRARGFDEVARNWHGFLAHGVAEIPLAKGATCVDLHWDTVALARDRRDVVLDVEGLFGHSVQRTVGSVEVSAPDATDTLLHLCVNAGLDGARRLSRLVDVDRVARDAALDWSRLVATACRGGAHALAHAVLRRAHVLLGTPVPAAVLADLSPFPGWSALTRPHLRRDGRLHRGLSGGLLVSSGRASAGATILALGRTVEEAVLERRGHGAVQPGGALDWQRGAPPEGSSRQHYLDWVAGATQ